MNCVYCGKTIPILRFIFKDNSFCSDSCKHAVNNMFDSHVSKWGNK